MKMSEAEKIIRGKYGFVVMFEWVRGFGLLSEHFPDVKHGETPIMSEEKAWDLARAFANKMRGKVVNLYVANACDFTPTPSYEKRYIKNREVNYAETRESIV